MLVAQRYMPFGTLERPANHPIINMIRISYREDCGPNLRIGGARLWADFWQLSERVYLSHAPWPVSGCTQIELPQVPDPDSLVRQYSRLQLAYPARPLPALPHAHFAPLHAN